MGRHRLTQALSEHCERMPERGSGLWQAVMPTLAGSHCMLSFPRRVECAAQQVRNKTSRMRPRSGCEPTAASAVPNSIPNCGAGRYPTAYFQAPAYCSSPVAVDEERALALAPNHPTPQARIPNSNDVTRTPKSLLDPKEPIVEGTEPRCRGP